MTALKDRKLNVTRALPDIHTKRLTMIHKSGPLPAKVDLRPYDIAIWDQGQEGSCTGHGWGAHHDFLRVKALREAYPQAPLATLKAEVKKSSPQFLYYSERAMDGDVGQDAGAQIPDGGKVLHNVGVCSEALWPYTEATLYTKPSAEAYTQAAGRKTNAPGYLLSSDNDVKACLAAGFPVVFGFTVYSSFDGVGADGIMPAPSGSIEGGHCVEKVGYDDVNQWWICRNSWGQSWGLGGYFLMRYRDSNDLAFDHYTSRL